MTLQPNFSNNSSQEHSFSFSQLFSYPMPMLRTKLFLQLLLHTDISWPLSPVLYCSAHFSALPTLNTPHSYAPHSFPWQVTTLFTTAKLILHRLPLLQCLGGNDHIFTTAKLTLHRLSLLQCLGGNSRSPQESLYMMFLLHIAGRKVYVVGCPASRYYW